MTRIGSNWFFGVEFPLVVGDRYVHIGPDPSGGCEPYIRVFRWDSEASNVEELHPAGGAVLTWEHDAGAGTVRLRSRAESAVGYVDVGPEADMLISLDADAIRIMQGGKSVAEFARSVVVGSEVGLIVDPVTGSIQLGGQLPIGFRYRISYQDQDVRLASLVSAHSPLLRNRTFTRCRIEGPALLVPRQGVEMADNRLNALGFDRESLVWSIPPSGQPYGAIIVDDVSFLECDLTGVGFAALSTQRDEFLTQLLG